MSDLPKLKALCRQEIDYITEIRLGNDREHCEKRRNADNQYANILSED